MVLVVALVTMGVTFAAPAQASDMSGPVLLNPSVTSKNLNLYNGPATINVTLRLVDETGVQTPTMIASWVNPDPWAWGGGQSQGFGRMTLASGTMKDGVWKHTITIPQGAATGQWAVTLYPLDDTWGNNSTFFKTLDTVTVTNEAPPTPVSPAAVTFTDKLGTKEDTYTVPATKGVEYLADGKVVPAGTYPGLGKVTLTARARTGFVLVSGAVSTWTATFKGLLVGQTPTISGTSQIGFTLTVDPGSWTPAPVSLGYQWYRTGVAISGATASTYPLAALDSGSTITVKITGSKAGYNPISKTSVPTAAVVKGSLTVSTPAITGTAKVGSALTAVSGAWGPAPVTLQYRWYRSGALILGATAATYVPAATDLAGTITVKVTGSKPGFTTVSRTSAATAAVVKGSLARSIPAITGIAKVGSKLTADAGAWGPAPVTHRYQWYRSGALVLGATAGTYTPTATDVAGTLTVKVTGSKPGYTTLSRTSVPTLAVAKGSLVKATPTITGTAKVGATLTADPGAWGPAPVAFRYQWYRSGASVIGANAPTYKPTASDAAKTLTVKVTGSKPGYITYAKTSAPTASVLK